MTNDVNESFPIQKCRVIEHEGEKWFASEDVFKALRDNHDDSMKAHSLAAIAAAGLLFLEIENLTNTVKACIERLSLMTSA